MTTQTTHGIPSEQLGPAERMLDVVLNGSAHLWHNRPGLSVAGQWHARRGNKDIRGALVAPGLFVPAAEKLYGQLLSIHELNADLMAHFASYALTQTDWRDLKVACAALMLVQPRAGQPVLDEAGRVAFHQDDHRAIGEAMVLHYRKQSTRMLTPKGVLRIAELLEAAPIADLNRVAGFADEASRAVPLGRWKKAATRWLQRREANPAMLEGLVKAGYKETLKKLARKVGYKPQDERFFAVLGWKQKQAEGGHRTMGLTGLKLERRERFDGLSEAEICETIESQRLKHKDVMGRLPEGMGLTPAIMVALLPGMSDRDIRQLTPTLEDLGLMAEPEIRLAWEKAVKSSTDQRALNIARNVKDKEVREKLVEAADNAARAAVSEAAGDTDLHVMFLVDKSGSMGGAIEQSIEALSRILAGFPGDKLHVASFDTVGTVHRPKAASRVAVQHMLGGIRAGGGTVHGSAVEALHRAGVRIPAGATLVVVVVGDEDGEQGSVLARAFMDRGYVVAAMALLLNVAHRRGETVRQCARTLGVPCSEVRIEQFEDPYQVPRVLKALMDAPREAGSMQSGWVARVMATPLLTVDGV